MSKVPTRNALDLHPPRPETQSVDPYRPSHLIPWPDQGSLRTDPIKIALTFGEGVHLCLESMRLGGGARRALRRDRLRGVFLALYFFQQAFHRCRRGESDHDHFNDPRRQTLSIGDQAHIPQLSLTAEKTQKLPAALESRNKRWLEPMVYGPIPSGTSNLRLSSSANSMTEGTLLRNVLALCRS